MKNLLLSAVAIFAITTSVMAETYPANGPDSYKALHDTYVEDVNRKGFRLGLGIGVANTSIDDYFPNDDLSTTSVATTFEIGYAPTNQISINYLNNVNWGSSDYDVSGLTALTVNYYLDNSIDTAYVVAGIGGAGYDSDVDGAAIFGIGYAIDSIEFEIDAVLSKKNDENMREFFFTMSYMFY